MEPAKFSFFSYPQLRDPIEVLEVRVDSLTDELHDANEIVDQGLSGPCETFAELVQMATAVERIEGELQDAIAELDRLSRHISFYKVCGCCGGKAYQSGVYKVFKCENCTAQVVAFERGYQWVRPLTSYRIKDTEG